MLLPVSREFIIRNHFWLWAVHLYLCSTYVALQNLVTFCPSTPCTQGSKWRQIYEVLCKGKFPFPPSLQRTTTTKVIPLTHQPNLGKYVYGCCSSLLHWHLLMHGPQKICQNHSGLHIQTAAVLYSRLWSNCSEREDSNCVWFVWKS